MNGVHHLRGSLARHERRRRPVLPPELRAGYFRVFRFFAARTLRFRNIVDAENREVRLLEVAISYPPVSIYASAWAKLSVNNHHRSYGTRTLVMVFSLRFFILITGKMPVNLRSVFLTDDACIAWKHSTARD